MSTSDPGQFSGHSTQELEGLLRQPDIPADRRQLISDELGRRYEAELSAATGSSTAPPRQEPSTPRRGPSKEPGPPSHPADETAAPRGGPPTAGAPPAGPPPA